MSTNAKTNQQRQNAAVYARVSSEEQVQGYSIQAQLRACREWAEKHGYRVSEEYLDEGYSASRNLEKRESFKEMLSNAASKGQPFDAIIVHKLDRFSRDSLESFTPKQSSSGTRSASSPSKNPLSAPTHPRTRSWSTSLSGWPSSIART